MFDEFREAARIFRRSLAVRIKGFKKYSGDADAICRQIIDDCWNGKYLQASTGHFCEFYVRDFTICVESLIKLGYKERVEKTLEYAMDIFSENRKITTTITPWKKPIDIYAYTPESLAYMLMSLRLANSKELIEKYREFLLYEAVKAFETVFDQKKGLLKQGVFMSSIKDNEIRSSSVYDNVAVALLSSELKALKIENPFKDYNIKKNIKDNFWTGSYFLDDLSGSKEIAGDANVFPFWTKVFTSRKMLKSCMEKIHEEGLDEPCPLKYKKEKQSLYLSFVHKLAVPNYEGNTIWHHLGLCYMKLVKDVNREKFRKHMDTYRQMIEKYGTFIELCNPDGTLYKTPCYCADEGMIWCSMFLALNKDLKI